jgi:hypothetical protein
VTEFSNLEITLYVWANKTRSNKIKVDEKPLVNYIEEFKKNLSNKRLNIEYIESYIHSDLIEAIKGKMNLTTTK